MFKDRLSAVVCQYEISGDYCQQCGRWADQVIVARDWQAALEQQLVAMAVENWHLRRVVFKLDGKRGRRR